MTPSIAHSAATTAWQRLDREDVQAHAPARWPLVRAWTSACSSTTAPRLSIFTTTAPVAGSAAKFACRDQAPGLIGQRASENQGIRRREDPHGSGGQYRCSYEHARHVALVAGTTTAVHPDAVRGRQDGKQTSRPTSAAGRRLRRRRCPPPCQRYVAASAAGAASARERRHSLRRNASSPKAARTWRSGVPWTPAAGGEDQIRPCQTECNTRNPLIPALGALDPAQLRAELRHLGWSPSRSR